MEKYDVEFTFHQEVKIPEDFPDSRSIEDYIRREAARLLKELINSDGITSNITNIQKIQL
jgi:hypothetical protein